MRILSIFNKDYDIESISTRQLLSLYKKSRKFTSSLCDCCSSYSDIEYSKYLFTSVFPILKEELSKREHVMSKLESKEYRKNRKKSGISRKK